MVWECFMLNKLGFLEFKKEVCCLLVLKTRLWLLSKGMSRHHRVMNLESCP
ncbi:hypothetical protein HanHA300_Chr09g0333541 [Helianthus annuus]|nr:hypothetical protein HanHA300_Chr09g0333541 [Helianthus annuus]KAJ0543798.1 hypothetical protein HanHA89_Chr09g0354521 [Helianthus annuus]KAJ0708847.1 hypothetical protein HanLR1_Chr09g0333781 [Helianthus annuus]